MEPHVTTLLDPTRVPVLQNGTVHTVHLAMMTVLVEVKICVFTASALILTESIPMSPSISVSVMLAGRLHPECLRAPPILMSAVFPPNPAPQTLPWSVSTRWVPFTAGPVLQDGRVMVTAARMSMNVPQTMEAVLLPLLCLVSTLWAPSTADSVLQAMRETGRLALKLTSAPPTMEDVFHWLPALQLQEALSHYAPVLLVMLVTATDPQAVLRSVTFVALVTLASMVNVRIQPLVMSAAVIQAGQVRTATRT